MVEMPRSNTPVGPAELNSLDQRVRKVDEDRWLSSRYAGKTERAALITLYAFNYELARIRLVVSEQTLGAMRYQWWRDALASIAENNPPEHEVAIALQGCLMQKQIDLDGLHQLIDSHEAAFHENDRGLEPEARLAGLAARIFVPAHGWGEGITALAPHWAALRRNEKVGYGPVVSRVPSGIRPAVAHFRLRRLYASPKLASPISKRISVFRAMMSGRV
ncbi:MAG: squalene/phytoene synthase family protein [Pseudomonadota bacterium]